MVLVDGSKCELKKPSECGIENMEAGELEAAMEAAMKRSGSDLEITAEEQDKFKKAFGDPEFRKMMAEYVDEISDPKYREEQNQYIREMEAKGETPKGKALIHPKAGFVVKTRKMGKADHTGAKVFINIVSSEKLQEPEATPCDGGSRWALPHLLGPPRMERDKKDATVSTFDCCFHPAAVQRANASKPFRDLLAQTAIESVEGSYERNSKGEKLERTYHVLLGVMYKTGHPQPLMVPDDHSTTQAKDVASALNKPPPKEDKENGAANKTNKKKKRNRKKKKGGAKDDEDELDDDIDTETPPPPKEFSLKGKLAAKMDAASAKKQGAKEAAATAAREKAAAMDPKELARARRILEAKGIAPASPPPPPEPKPEGPPYEPVVRIKERGYFDMGNHMSGGSTVQRRPKELVVSVELPLLPNAKSVDLEVDARDFSLTASLDGASLVYKLKRRLPYDVDGAKGAAKFDRKQKVLNVTIPVLPGKVDPPPDESAFPGVLDVSPAPAEDPVEDLEAFEEPPTKPKKAPVPARPAKATDHNRWLAPKESERMAFAADAIKASAPDDDDDDDDDGAPAIDAVLKDDNLQAARSAAAGFRAAPDAPDDPSFVAAACYAGPKPGYYFAMKHRRLGYHRDDAQCPPEPAAAAPPPDDALPAPAFEARQQKATATVIVEAAGVTDVATRFEGRVCHVRLVSPAGVREFALALGGFVVPDRCRHDAADDNVVFVFAKASPAFWDAPVAELAAFAPAAAAAPAAAPKKKAAAKKTKKAAAAPKEAAAAAADPEEDPEEALPPTLSRATELDTKAPAAAAPAATFNAPEFQNTLLFDID